MGTVILIGMMGVGKTAVGKRIAEALGVSFFDTDAMIEEKFGLSISEIFEYEGEGGFREKEKSVISGLPDDELCVVSTGGGAFMFVENKEKLKAMGTSFYLRASLDTLMKRLEHEHSQRPLLKGDMMQELRRLLSQREAVYMEADYVIDVDDISEMEIAQRIISIMEGAR